ncbi:MAG TPA: type II toxin-antitoxin system PrlF family antitoxin [Stellaceae bacterium]|nr:type II toxin-antitoxin system PrlF family antitoxin [Stellaceae bacterium]
MTSKGQTTIPKRVREHLGIGPGDRVRFGIEPDGTVTLVPATLPVTALRGIARRAGPAASLEEMEAAIRAGAARSLDRR